MGNYIVSARKYRPDTFASVVGQSHITDTLKGAILMGQLAHAFLFSGPRGVGKTTCARILAKAINCEQLTEEGEPCNQCTSCQSYNQGKSINIHELDAASNNSVDDIRNLIEQTRYVPQGGTRSVYIIDEVHMLSQAAFNAFLKTLEEPPAHVLFILATTEKHKILPTILSRCQKFDFRRIRVDDIAQHLQYISDAEEIDCEYAALQQIALKADGALRDALSLFDQQVSYNSGTLTFAKVLENLNILDYEYYFQTVDHMSSQDHAQLLLLLDEIVQKGFEAKDFVVGLTAHFRNLLVCQQPETIQLLETSENVKKRYQEQSQQLPPTILLNAFHLCSEAEQQTKSATHPRLTVELLLIKLAHLHTAVTVAQNGTDVVHAGKKKILTDPPKSPPQSTPPNPAKEPKKTHTQSELQTQESSAPVEPAPPEIPVKNSSSQVEVEPATVPLVSKTRSKRKRSTSIPLANSFQSMNQQIRQKIAEESEKQTDKDEPVSFDINPQVEVDPERLQSILLEYSAQLKEQNKMNLASILENGTTTLEHNKWRFSVENDLLKGMLEREQDLLPYLREKLQVPDLFGEYFVDESNGQNQTNIPYTNEEKLLEMSKENPQLEQFQKIFNTRIIYE